MRPAHLLAIAALIGCAFASPASASPVSSAASCGLVHKRGESTVSLAVAGRSRPFRIYVPRRYSDRTRVPLVVLLHGSGDRGVGQMTKSRMRTTADRHGFVVAAPNGGARNGRGYTWVVPGAPVLGNRSRDG